MYVAQPMMLHTRTCNCEVLIFSIGGHKTYSDDFGGEAHVVLPSHAQHIRQVEGKVDDAPAGCCQVGTCERCTDQETLHDGYNSK